jgi:poly-beta-1,6-N-acetyl-D-glucosamine synthase
VMVVSDGSDDGTEEIAARFSSRGVRTVRVQRAGKPSALNTGVELTSGEIIVFTDVRQQLDPQSLKALLAPFADPTVGVVSGYLVIRAGGTEEDNVGLYWRYERWIRQQLSKVDSLFGATGSYYAIRRDLFRPMPADLLLDDMYVPLAAFFAGYRLIIEKDAKAYDYPTGINAEFRRKVRTLAGNYQILNYFPLLTPRNRMLFHFLSYKFARLLLPWLVLGLLAVSFWLPDPLRILALGAQVLFYVLAAFDGIVPDGNPVKRLTSPARTIAGMLAATACAVMIFFVPPQVLWRQGHTAAGTKA